MNREDLSLVGAVAVVLLIGGIIGLITGIYLGVNSTQEEAIINNAAEWVNVGGDGPDAEWEFRWKTVDSAE